MKRIIFGDIHGRPIWKDILNNTEYDQAIFVGDYFDSRDGINPNDQIDNFLEICDKKMSDGNIIMLLGNHDFHYIFNEKYSGFQSTKQVDINIALIDNLDKIDICYVVDENDRNYLISHAGFTKTWLKKYLGNENFNKTVGPQVLKDFLLNNRSIFSFSENSEYSRYGDDITQSCIWVRPYSLSMDMIDDFIQIVGHTTQNSISVYENKLYLIDTLGTSKQTLILDNGNVIINPFYNSNDVVAF